MGVVTEHLVAEKTASKSTLWVKNSGWRVGIPKESDPKVLRRSR